MGIYVVIGASLLGVFSCMLIAWSLWTRSQVRKRARARQLATGQHAAIPPTSGAYPAVQAPAGHTVVASPPGYVEEEPRTEFISSGDLLGHVGAPDEPTQFLSEADLLGAEPKDEHEAATAFMTTEELFGEEDEHEVPTAFMTTDELFGRARAPVDATVVLAKGAVIPGPNHPPAQRVPQPSVAAGPELKPTLPGPKPAASASRYTGFVGDRTLDDDDDDDFDFDADDPETELVHQAEILRLIGTTKRSD